MIKQTPPIFVISLVRATERRAAIIPRLDDSKMHYEIVDAVDGATLDLSKYATRLDQESAIKNYGVALTVGEVGCYLSHYQLWERMIKEQIEYAVILEDDTCWENDFAQVINDIIACEWQWDIVLMHGTGFRRVWRHISSIGKSRKMVQYKRPVFNTSAYCISLSGAKKLVNYCHIIKLPIDLAWQKYWEWNGRFYFINPYPATITGAESDIMKMGRDINHTYRRTQIQKQYLRRWYHFLLHRPIKKKKEC